jgi:hypothetical protein
MIRSRCSVISLIYRLKGPRGLQEDRFTIMNCGFAHASKSHVNWLWKIRQHWVRCKVYVFPRNRKKKCTYADMFEKIYMKKNILYVVIYMFSDEKCSYTLCKLLPLLLLRVGRRQEHAKIGSQGAGQPLCLFPSGAAQWRVVLFSQQRLILSLL